MDDAVRAILKDIVARHGRELVKEPRRCAEVVRENLGLKWKLEAAALNTALQEGVVERLVGMPAASITRTMVVNAAGRMSAETGLKDDLAQWAIATWASAFGLAIAGQETTVDRDEPPREDETKLDANDQDRSRPAQEVEPANTSLESNQVKWLKGAGLLLALWGGLVLFLAMSNWWPSDISFYVAPACAAALSIWAGCDMSFGSRNSGKISVIALVVLVLDIVVALIIIGAKGAGLFATMILAVPVCLLALVWSYRRPSLRVLSEKRTIEESVVALLLIVSLFGLWLAGTVLMEVISYGYGLIESITYVPFASAMLLSDGAGVVLALALLKRPSWPTGRVIAILLRGVSTVLLIFDIRSLGIDVYTVLEATGLLLNLATIGLFAFDRVRTGRLISQGV